MHYAAHSQERHAEPRICPRLGYRPAGCQSGISALFGFVLAGGIAIRTRLDENGPYCPNCRAFLACLRPTAGRSSCFTSRRTAIFQQLNTNHSSQCRRAVRGKRLLPRAARPRASKSST